MQKIVKARFLCTERKFKTMSQHLLDIENLTVAVEDKEILHGVNLWKYSESYSLLPSVL